MDFSSLHTLFSLLVAGLVLTLPGMAFLLLARQALDRERAFSLANTLMLGVGLSIAFWPLLLLYTSLLGVAFSPLFLWIALALCGLYVGYRLWSLGIREWLPHDARWTALALLGICALALIFRLGDIAGLDVPMFGDSLHHTMVTAIILDTGRLPGGYLPYVPVDTYTYHFGFHTLSAVLGQLTGLSAPQAVLLMSQALNVLTVPVAYALNRQLFGSRIAGLGAAFLAGFVSIMPAFYVNWGRFTQLAGHVLLVIALALLARAMSKGWRRSDLASAAFCVAGLVVVHYRVLIFFALFAFALGLYQLVNRWGKWRSLLAGWGRGIGVSVAGLVLTLPWLINLAANYFPGLFGRLKSVTPDYLVNYDNPDTIRVYLGVVLPLVALLGVALALVEQFRLRRQRTPQGNEQAGELTPNGAAAVLALWTLFLVGSLWPVPGAIGSYTIAISLYIPLCALGGYAIALVARWIPIRVRLREPVVAMLLLLAAPIAAFGTGTWHIADPGNYSYVHDADERAFAWIMSNTPQGAKFLISSEFSYTGRGLTATDAGMWLPILAHRNVSVPSINTWMERPIDTAFFTDTRKLAAYTQPLKLLKPGDLSQPDLVSKGIIPAPGNLSSPEALALMQQMGITYIFSGAKLGHSQSRLDIETLRRDTRHYRLLYFQEGVYVFGVTP